jgi:hypothetical protein
LGKGTGREDNVAAQARADNDFTLVNGVGVEQFEVELCGHSRLSPADAVSAGGTAKAPTDIEGANS